MLFRKSREFLSVVIPRAFRYRTETSMGFARKGYVMKMKSATLFFLIASFVALPLMGAEVTRHPEAEWRIIGGLEKSGSIPPPVLFADPAKAGYAKSFCYAEGGFFVAWDTGVERWNVFPGGAFQGPTSTLSGVDVRKIDCAHGTLAVREPTSLRVFGVDNINILSEEGSFPLTSFGECVRVSGDGNSVFVCQDTEVTFFEWGDDSWSPGPSIIEPDVGGLDVSESGNQVLLGLPDTDSVDAVVRDSSTWVSQPLVYEEPQPGSWFGNDLECNWNMSKCVIGAPNHDNATGKVYIGGFNGSSWFFASHSSPEGLSEGDWFGFSVGVSQYNSDVLGVLPFIVGATETGAAIGVLFAHLVSETWTERHPLGQPNGADFGNERSLLFPHIGYSASGVNAPDVDRLMVFFFSEEELPASSSVPEDIFADGFESGDTTAWSSVVP